MHEMCLLVLLRLFLHYFLLCDLVFTKSVANSVHEQHSCHGDERIALLQFKQSFLINKYASGSETAYPKLLEWKPEENSNCCSWDGIQCDEHSGHVISLDVSSSFLYGFFNSNSTLFQLFHLQRLNLADNYFNGSQIPTLIGQFSRLTYLNLSVSAFFGQVPSEILRLSNLSSLDLSGNYDSSSGEWSLKLGSFGFNGLVQHLTSLEQLNLSGVDISSTLPESLVNLTSLTSLFLEDCGLYGEFPVKVFQLSNLRTVNVGYNYNLTGYLPELHHGSLLTTLKVRSTRFSGSLASLEKFESLAVFDASDCNFSGPIPSSLGKLTNLVYLSLDSSNLSGYIPSSFQNLTQLRVISFFRNRLIGTIPSWLGNLTQITRIDLQLNEFHGLIPQSLSKLVNLQELSLSANNLAGTVDFDMFFNIKSLFKLQLGLNDLSLVFGKGNINATLSKFKHLSLGTCNLVEFPDFLRYQNNLTWLVLSGNKIYGQIPKWMWSTSLDTLITFNIAENCLTSFHQSTAIVLPHSNLRKLNLSFNKLRGPLLIPPPSLVDYNVSNNMLTGEIPPLFCKLSSLSSLSLSNNNLSGMIPQCLGNFSDSLSVLDLRNNSLQGSIPQMCKKASNLRLIDLSYNQLQGKLPQSLSKCMGLQALSLSNNQLNDVFPSWLGSLPELKVLTLRRNGFHGVIGKPEKDLKYFPKLQIIDLSYNHFTGELPYHYMLNWNAMTELNLPNNATYMDANWVYTLPNSYGSEYIYRYTITLAYKGVEIYYSAIQDVFAFVDLSSNKFEGEIPEFIGNLEALHSLNLSNNMLSGRIPTSLGNLSVIESLDLSRNNLSGEIPQQLNQLGFLAYFNVSHNNLTGPIPRGNQFNTMEQSSFELNPGLCGDPLPKKCGNSKVFPPPSSIFVEDNNDLGSSIELDWKFVLAGLTSGLVVGLVLGDFVTKKRQTWTWLVKNFGKWVPIRKGRQ